MIELAPTMAADPDPARLALEHALALAREQVATLEAALARSGELVPLKRAAAAMGLSEEAARKRAVRGEGVKRDGCWHFRAAYVEARRRP